MINLTNILSEVIQTYQIEASLFSDPRLGVVNMLDQIRGLEKVTIVNNITPEEYLQKQNIEYTRIKLKFVTRTDPKQDIINMKKEMTTSNLSTSNMRIDGLKNVKFKMETLKRL